MRVNRIGIGASRRDLCPVGCGGAGPQSPACIATIGEHDAAGLQARRAGQPVGPVEDIQYVSDLQARFKGREILATEESVQAVDIWDGERRVIRLGATGNRAATPPPAIHTLRPVTDLQGMRDDADDR